ncbi:MAG: polysaccharide deacetylase family protein [Verrucomicrobiia bacterium]|jgi:peptidoglycan/xylan/chitin deacetylase (PgdA/CDA1 family)
MRLDRLITLGLVQPIHRAVSGAKRAQLPILMYHSISEGAEDAVSPYYRTVTRPAIFAQHMALLHVEGYRVVSLQAGLHEFRSGCSDIRKTVVLTFDDGLRDFYTSAFPILQEYEQTASVFLPTAFIGDQPGRFKGRECMTWSEARELNEAGIEIGSHTVNHPRLYELGFDEIRAELANSKAVIEDRLGSAVVSFAYPYAFPSGDRRFVARLEELLRAAKYECGVTTRIGRASANDQLFTLPRLPMNSADDRSLFLAKLQGAYDWLAVVQTSFKGLSCRAPRRTNTADDKGDDSSCQPSGTTPASPGS